MINVVLVEPEIPANTGNIGRTCVLAGARLHLVGPMGFELSDQAVRRAGLAYWESLDLRTYPSWELFVERHPHVQDALAAAERDAPDGKGADCGTVGPGHPGSHGGTGSSAGSPRSAGTPLHDGGTRPSVHLLTKGGARTYAQSTYGDGDWLVFGKESAGLDAGLLGRYPQLCERIPMRGDDALGNARSWHASFDTSHQGLRRDICGNYVDPRAGQITSLNLSNAVAIVLYEALRQTGFAGLS